MFMILVFFHCLFRWHRFASAIACCNSFTLYWCDNCNPEIREQLMEGMEE